MDIVEKLRDPALDYDCLHRMVAANEIERLRALLTRQYNADAALYAIPDDCTAEDHAAALSEHDAVHLVLAAELTRDVR